MNQRKQSSTTYPVCFFMADSTDHVTGKTGLTPTVTLGKNGAVGALGAASGAVVEMGNGWYSVAGHATDRDTVGELVYHASAAGADPADVKIVIVPWDPFDATKLGLTGVAVPGSQMDLQNAPNATAIEAFRAAFRGEAFILKGTVNTVASGSDFTLTSAQLLNSDDEYKWCYLVFTSGLNTGIARVIQVYTGSTGRVQFTGSGQAGAFPRTVAPGDAWEMLGVSS